MKFEDKYANAGLTFFLSFMLLYIIGCAVLMILGLMPVTDLGSWGIVSIGFFGIGAWIFCQIIGPYTIIINEEGLRAKRSIGKWKTYSWEEIVDSGVRRRQTGADIQYSFYFATFMLTPYDLYCQRTPKQKLNKDEIILDVYFSKRAMDAIRAYAPDRIREMINNSELRDTLKRLMDNP